MPAHILMNYGIAPWDSRRLNTWFAGNGLLPMLAKLRIKKRVDSQFYQTEHNTWTTQKRLLSLTS